MPKAEGKSKLITMPSISAPPSVCVFRELRTDTLYVAVGVGFEKVSMLLLLPVLARNLSVEGYGVWMQMLVTTSLVVSVLLFGLPGSAAKVLAAPLTPRRASTTNAVLLTVCGAATFCGILWLIFPATVAYAVLGTQDLSFYMAGFGALVVTDVVISLLLTILQSWRRIRLMAVYSTIRLAGRIVIMTLCVAVLGVTLEQAVLVFAGFQAILLMLIYLRSVLPCVKSRLRYAEVDYRGLVGIGFPVVASAMCTWIATFVNRYFLLHLVGLREVGIYAASATLSSVPQIFASILGLTVYPHACRLWEEHRKKQAVRVIQVGIECVLFAAIPCVVAIGALQEFVIRLFCGPDFVQGGILMPLLTLNAALAGVYQLLMYGLLVADRSRMVFSTAAASGLVAVTTSCILISPFGLIGAAVATIAANLFACVAAWLAFSRATGADLGDLPLAGVVRNGALMAAPLLAARLLVGNLNLGVVIALLFAGGVVYLALDVHAERSIIRRSMLGLWRSPVGVA